MTNPNRRPGEGTLEPVGDRWRLRFERVLPHPPEKVWQALTQEEHLKTWFPTTIDGELQTGARLTFRHRGGELPPTTGEMIACEHGRLLEFTWGFSEDPRDRPEHTRIELHPEGKGCRLVFTTTYDKVGKSARDGAGWHDCLDLLAAHLRGEPLAGSGPERWKGLNRLYRERFGPEAGTIGPPESMTEYH